MPLASVSMAWGWSPLGVYSDTTLNFPISASRMQYSVVVLYCSTIIFICKQIFQTNVLDLAQGGRHVLIRAAGTRQNGRVPAMLFLYSGRSRGRLGEIRYRRTRKSLKKLIKRYKS